MRFIFANIYVGVLFVVFAFSQNANGHSHKSSSGKDREILPGAWRTEEYFPELKGKRVAVAGNHTSMVRDVHLVDTLLSSGLDVVKIFSPEHGFRGRSAAGEMVESGRDPDTGLPVVSLYGTNRRPTQEQLSDVDVIVFDIQDVGARFYTYISTMTYIMEEAAQLDLPVIILDRPNPNGHYVDGPVLEPEYSSFVGLHPVPVVHGMTIGEYAMMVNGEGWLKHNKQCDLHIVTVKNYTHLSRYTLPIPPSPNLPNMRSISLYPSLCFFEGTVISIGRGTDKPFQVYGHSRLPASSYAYRFTPQSITASPNPPQLGKECLGVDLSYKPTDALKQKDQINLDYILDAFRNFPDKKDFFNSFLENLAGNSNLRQQIIEGYTACEIRETWQKDLKDFKQIRSKYLLYPDFE